MGATYLHPFAGYIYPGAASRHAGRPGPLGAGELRYLRDLAKKVSEIAAAPEYEQKKRRWQKHNDLEPSRPMYVCYAEHGWADLLGDGRLEVESPFWREYEWYLLHLMYRHEKIDDDFVIGSELPYFVDYVVENANYGLSNTYSSIPETGACVGSPLLENFSDMKKMKTPSLSIDEKTTESRHEALRDAFGDILEVKPCITGNFASNQPGILAGLRGIERMMTDMYDEPEFLHELLAFVTLGIAKIFGEMKNSGYVRSNIGNFYVDSGGNGFSGEWAEAEGDPDCFGNMWGFGVAQEFSEVSPEHHYEFGVKYQAETMKLFGVNSYGCCEPYTNKFEMLKTYVPNLRRVSVSAWCDAKKAAESLKDGYIISLKPNPAILLYENDRQKVKDYVAGLLEDTRGCAVELFLKDIISLKGRERNFVDSAKIMRETISEVYDQ